MPSTHRHVGVLCFQRENRCTAKIRLKWSRYIVFDRTLLDHANESVNAKLATRDYSKVNKAPFTAAFSSIKLKDEQLKSKMAPYMAKQPHHATDGLKKKFALEKRSTGLCVSHDHALWLLLHTGLHHGMQSV